jgi:pimeloyl-ACP methyl ester carboxylesterase
MPPAEFFVLNDDVRLACLDYGGSGPPVVLLHGAMRNLGEWESIAPRLARHHRVVSMDLRGHGASDAVAAFSLEAALVDLDAVVSQGGLDNPSVVGHSLGGIIATLYGLRHPECPAIVNIDGTPSILPHLSTAELARLEAFRAGSAATRGADHGSTQWLDGVLASLQGGVAGAGIHVGLTDPFVRRHYHLGPDGLFYRRPSDSLTRSVIAALDSVDLLGAYRALPCRALVFNCHRVDPAHPIHDILIGYRETMRKDLAEAEAVNPNVHVVDYDTGHMITVDQPAVVIDELMRFLDAPRQRDTDTGLPRN